MSKEGNIIWLASYPKSGNTWLRIFLNNLLSEKEEIININALYEIDFISSERVFFDETVGVDSIDLTLDEIDYYLPYVHTLRSQQLTEKKFIKTHDAYTKNKQGNWIIPVSTIYKTIYLIRNPLDICVSFAYHFGHTNFNKMIKQMANPKTILAESKTKPNNQLHQYMGSWSSHVNSWTNLPNNKLLVIRYEDMKLKPQATFTKIIRFIGLKHSDIEIVTALEKSDIKKLQKIEDERGFIEKMHKAQRFFRKGIVGSWQQELTKKQVQQIIKDHKELMIKYDYLDANGVLKV